MISFLTPKIVAITLTAYLLGSVSFSFLAGRWHERDLRDSGSGNLGAINTARVLGPASGVVVLILDMAKGFFAVWVAKHFSSDPTAIFLACFAVMLGHNFSIFLKFSGGKGIAVAGGFLLLISPLTFAAELAVGGISILLSKDMHLAAIVMLIALAPLLGFFGHSWTFFGWGLALAVLSLVRHKRDLLNLWKKTSGPVVNGSRGDQSGE